MMQRGGKRRSGEGPAEKRENLGEKLKRGAVALLVGQRGGHTTPVLSPCTIQLLAATDATDAQDSIIKVSPLPSSVSARKLAATLWELHHYKLPLTKMHQGVPVPPRLRRLHNHRHRHLFKDKDIEHPDPSPSSPDLPGSASSLKRHVAVALMQHHRSIDRNNHAIQPASPASYGSSMEMAPYNPAVTPNSSLDLRGKTGDISYSLKTSTELLKVLNRIWGLEEQHASNISLVKAMKKELDHARSRIKELVREQQTDRQEIDELVKQIAEDKAVRKSKEQDRVSAAIQSVRDELEDERKLRKRSESLHRKLARELFEVKTSLANALKELEREKKSRNLLEDLCDEFAWGIRDYEQEVHALKQKSDKVWGGKADEERLALHISESWLDERMQMKLQSQYGTGEKNSTVDKLSSEIVSFLHARRIANHNSNDNLGMCNPTFRRNSLESIPLNVAVSTHQDDADEEDSTGSDSHCFELSKPGASNPHTDQLDKSHFEEAVNPNYNEKKNMSCERTNSRSPTSLQVKFEEQNSHAILQNGGRNLVEDMEHVKFGEANPIEVSISKKSEICEAAQVGSSEKRNKVNGTSGMNSNYTIDNLIRNHCLLSESGNQQPENDYGVSSHGDYAWASHASPVRQWTARLPSQELDIAELSSKLPPDLKENTLKAKLLEARTRGQRSRSRLKVSKIAI